MNYTPQCILLNPKGHVTAHEWGTPPGLGLREHYRVFIKPIEWNYIPGDLSGLSYYKNEEIPWLKYIADATKIKVTSHVNAIEVVERPNLEVMESTMGGNSGGYVIRAVIKNTGDGKALVDEITLNLRSYKILYKPDELDVGGESDIIVDVDLESLSSLTGPVEVTINYRAENLGCLREKEFTATFELDVVGILNPHRSSQAYRMEVAGGCVNQYYSCYSPDKGGVLAAGYECFNRDPYFIPTKERFDLGFDLSSIPEGKDIASATINLNVGGVNRDQDLTVYSSDDDGWSPGSCEAEK
ncbi:MAG: hypothetical protein KAU03_01180, partial [Candidatus Altiarchaeales archaeon]|nr:hypothetical protein [Candidatus Altiarchaeales archaeon]